MEQKENLLLKPVIYILLVFPQTQVQKLVQLLYFHLCLWSGSSPTPEEEKWIDLFNEIVDNCVDHLLRIKTKLENLSWKEMSLKTKRGLNPLYWKRKKLRFIEFQIEDQHYMQN